MRYHYHVLIRICQVRNCTESPLTQVWLSQAARAAATRAGASSGARDRACGRDRGNSCRRPAPAPRRAGGCRRWRRRGARARRSTRPRNRSMSTVRTRRFSTTIRPAIITLWTALPSSLWTSWLTGLLNGSQFGWSRSRHDQIGLIAARDRGRCGRQSRERGRCPRSPPAPPRASSSSGATPALHLRDEGGEPHRLVHVLVVGARSRHRCRCRD